MTAGMPRLRIAGSAPERTVEQPQNEVEAGIPADAGAEVKARRERESLRQQLDEAVKAENFEKAIELRDQLRKLDDQ